MHRSVPVTNKILQKKWLKKLQNIHESHLKEIKGSIVIHKPPKFSHLKTRAKRDQMLEGKISLDRYTEIERENRILLEKITGLNSNPRPRKHERAKRSLNEDSRRRNLRQITVENQELLKRLRNRPPSYSVHKWEEDRKKRQKLLECMCEYPYMFGEKKDKFRSGTAHGSRRNSPGRTFLVYKKEINLDEQNFLVQIYKKDDKITVLTHSTIEPQSFTIDLNYSHALSLMGKPGNYDKLTDMLRLNNHALELVEAETHQEDDGKGSLMPHEDLQRPTTQYNSRR